MEAIIQFFETIPFGSEGYPCWGRAIVKEKDGDKTIKIKRITREEALLQIKKMGLICTLSDKSGKVYDTEGRDFYKAAQGAKKRKEGDEEEYVISLN